VSSSLRVVQTRDKSANFGILVFELQKFVFVQSFFSECHLPIVVLWNFLHVLLISERLVVELLSPRRFFSLLLVFLLQLQLLHIGNLLLLFSLNGPHLLLVFLVIHLTLQRTEAILFQTRYFVLFLCFAFCLDDLILRPSVLFPVNSLFNFVIVGWLNLLLIQLLPVLEILVVIVELLLVVVLFLLHLPLVVVTAL